MSSNFEHGFHPRGPSRQLHVSPFGMSAWHRLAIGGAAIFVLWLAVLWAISI
jgi:hypothetical protein